MRRFASLYDWVYHHHTGLVVACVALAVAASLLAITGRREAGRRRRWATTTAAGVLVVGVAVVVAGWVLSDRRSDDRDIARRVAQVSRSLPRHPRPGVSVRDFVGRNGCDGAVEVTVTTRRTGPDSTTTQVTGSCED